jgi:hypothetical protein
MPSDANAEYVIEFGNCQCRVFWVTVHTLVTVVSSIVFVQQASLRAGLKWVTKRASKMKPLVGAWALSALGAGEMIAGQQARPCKVGKVGTQYTHLDG